MLYFNYFRGFSSVTVLAIFLDGNSLYQLQESASMVEVPPKQCELYWQKDSSLV